MAESPDQPSCGSNVLSKFNKCYYDGNIRNQYWKSSIDGIQRAYQYSYDEASRITGATYSGKTGENYALNSVSYDFNGNIKTLSRNGWRSDNSFGLVDNLNYTYHTNSNKILKVDDISLETASFTDATGATDYTYYADGSLKSDANKGISLIEYNYLKLPKRLVQNGVTTLYQYDATGRKLKETIGTHVTDYSANKIYKNATLYQISHDEGRIISGEYEYNIKDHLGNLRVSFSDSLGVAKITQANSYGAWGEELPTLSYLKSAWRADNFKFTGKESLQGTGYTDFGARWYDNIVPRFTTIDPLAESLNSASPFVFSLNSSILFKDIGGGLPILVNGRVSDNSERGNAKYWANQILSTIRNSGIPNPHSTANDEFFFVDGDRGMVTDYGSSYADPSAAMDAESREMGGYLQAKEDFSKVLSLLHKNSITGKIDEKIQIYTHSRGGAFGQGYLEGLLEMIKANPSLFADPNKVIDLVILLHHFEIRS